MTVFGSLSRALNRMSGGPQGQTLCARIAERCPECVFCRLMSRIVEPNHCAIELAHWQTMNVDRGAPRTNNTRPFKMLSQKTRVSP